MNEFDLRHGDNMDLLPLIPDCSIDSCVTDPPYELGFMGKTWDSSGIANNVQFWKEVFRVLKPGAQLLAFGGTRTYHRMVCAIEDAGFEIRDSIHWIYGSGFPKSLDISKAIDKAAGMQREVVSTGATVKRMIPGADQDKTGSWIKDNGRTFTPSVTVAASEAAKQWEGYGTAIKPSHEPIVLARKPLSEKTVAANVLRWGTGALNVDGCRIGTADDMDPRDFDDSRRTSPKFSGTFNGGKIGEFRTREGAVPDGRWPANVIFDEAAAAELDHQSGHLQSGNPSGLRNVTGYCGGLGGGKTELWGYGDEGGASRFFYVAKASTSERGDGNNHPTVKPVELMQYLCRLITPPGGIVLDPFTGSGSTGIAALREGFRFIGLEREAEYIEIARRRIANDNPLFNRESCAGRGDSDVSIESSFPA